MTFDPSGPGLVVGLEVLGGLAIAILAWKSWAWRKGRIGNRAKQLAAAVEDRTRELTAEKARADAANRLKSQFLANISHEIRTPMNGVLGTLELALMTELTTEQRDYLELSRSSAESLLALLDDILDFSKIEAERLEISRVDFSLGNCLRGVVSAMAPQAETKGLELWTDVASDVPDWINGDPDRLRQVLLKMVENAIKFSSAGKILVGVRLDVEAGDPDVAATLPLSLLFSVQDSGAGIAKDKQLSVFEAFRQADGSATRKYGGTGLGLAICGRLVRLMDGRIWVDSEEGQGSKFYFTARFGRAGSALPPQVTRNGAVTRKDSIGSKTRACILLVEDNRLNQLVALRLLEKRGFRTLVAGNGLEAIQMLQWEKVDLVLMDVQMPEMDGFEATRRIREQEKKTGAHLPILAMTAHALDGDREKCLSAGMDGYLAKPVQSAQLYKAIEDLLVPAAV